MPPSAHSTRQSAPLSAGSAMTTTRPANPCCSHSRSMSARIAVGAARRHAHDHARFAVHLVQAIGEQRSNFLERVGGERVLGEFASDRERQLRAFLAHRRDGGVELRDDRRQAVRDGAQRLGLQRKSRALRCRPCLAQGLPCGSFRLRRRNTNCARAARPLGRVVALGAEYGVEVELDGAERLHLFRAFHQ